MVTVCNHIYEANFEMSIKSQSHERCLQDQCCLNPKKFRSVTHTAQLLVFRSCLGRVLDRRSSNGQQQLFLGIPSGLITDFIAPVIAGDEPEFKTLGIRLGYIGLSTLREFTNSMGLDDRLARRIEKQADRHGGSRRAVVVTQRWLNTPGHEAFVDNDVILAVDGSPITCIRDVDLAVQGKDQVVAEVFRNGSVLTINARTFDPLKGKIEPVDRMVLWAGAVLMDIPEAISWMYSRVALKGVFVSTVAAGSPSQRYRLPANRMVLEVDGIPTPDLDSFLQAVKTTTDPTGTFRVKLADLRGKTYMTTLTTDQTNWPLADVRLVGDEWERITIEDANEETSTADTAIDNPFTSP